MELKRAEANFAWEEFTVENGTGGEGGLNLNRKISSMGTKASGETWTAQIDVTLS